MKGKFKNHITAGVVIAIALGFIVSGVSVFAQNYNRSQENPLVLTADHYVIVENSSAWPGTTGHNINITGIYSGELFGYTIELYFETARVDDVIPIEINLDGCVVEDPYYFNYTIQHDNRVSVISVSNIFTDDWSPGNGVPAGEGKLFNLVVDISEEAEFQIIEINDEILAHPPILYTLAGGETELIEGYLEIFRVPNPPDAPDQPEGPTNGSIDVSYAYTTNRTGGSNTWYKFDFGDGESDWIKPEPGEKPQASHTWTEPGTYEVKAKAKNQYDEESEWSEPFAVEISSLSIMSISGGLGITAVIQNKGETLVSNVEWTINIDGGLFILTKGKSGTIATLGAGESKEVHMWFVFGIGLGFYEDMPIVTVTTTVPEEDTSIVESVDAIILLFFVSI